MFDLLRQILMLDFLADRFAGIGQNLSGIGALIAHNPLNLVVLLLLIALPVLAVVGLVFLGKFAAAALSS